MASSVSSGVFGTFSNGTKVRWFRLHSASGVEAEFIEYGAILRSLTIPDGDGRVRDCVLGFDTLEHYVQRSRYFGATIGRCANRIANASFDLAHTKYELAANNGPNALHGGERGFDKQLWSGSVTDDGAVHFKYESAHMEEGYPGRLHCIVSCKLDDTGALSIHFQAEIVDDALETIVNMCNHSYFNLDGHDGGSTVLEHVVQIEADAFTPIDANLIPTGAIKSVESTPFDFRRPKRIGSDIAQLEPHTNGGYDHNFVLNDYKRAEPLRMRFAARAESLKSGIILECYTTEPGLQFYTGNFLDGSIIGKNGASYGKHVAFCFESQHFPDSVHQLESNFPSVRLKRGDRYSHRVMYRLHCKQDA